jgi:hypothetical protein
VKEGADGGKRAASLLKQAVEEELRACDPSAAQHVQVVVRVYANMQGLTKTYKEMGFLPQSTTFEEFVRGFNMGDVMCDYVDAGNGKECSDAKVKGKRTNAETQHSIAHHTQQCFSAIMRMFTVGGSCSAGPLTTVMLDCLGRYPRVRLLASESLSSLDPLSLVNWPRSRTGSVLSLLRKYFGARNCRVPNIGLRRPSLLPAPRR